MRSSKDSGLVSWKTIRFELTYLDISKSISLLRKTCFFLSGQQSDILSSLGAHYGRIWMLTHYLLPSPSHSFSLRLTWLLVPQPCRYCLRPLEPANCTSLKIVTSGESFTKMHCQVTAMGAMSGNCPLRMRF